MIYVQIASYRDPELAATLRDLFSKADKPKDLRVCIAYQYDEVDYLSHFANHEQVRVIYIPYQESKGACWARHMVNTGYNGEEYTLQLDSHHRFAKGWDTTCIEMLESLPGKPVLTTYAPSYSPETDERVDNPWCMQLDTNLPMDIPSFRPYYSSHTEPKPTYFFSGHFVFARGEFITDVPYDPELYFHGEEITMAARAWVKGYEMYHPHKVVLWHEYTRNNRAKQWDDNSEWWKMDLSSKDKVRKILSGEIKIEGERTIEEYMAIIKKAPELMGPVT